MPYTLLDTPRMANIWQLSQLTDPAGVVVELGVYRGGGSVLLGKACEGRELIVADTFSGFGEKHKGLSEDNIFEKKEFINTSRNEVDSLLKSHFSNYSILEGYFPDSDVDGIVANVSFAHIDFDLYESTIQSLNYLAPRSNSNAIFVLDDYRRDAAGVDLAVSEFLTENPEWIAFPIYPGQALLCRRNRTSPIL